MTNYCDIPFIIQNNPGSLELWNSTSKEARLAGVLISEFRAGAATANVAAYFDFAEKWEQSFPKSDKNYHDYGNKVIKIGAKMAGSSPSSIYSILRIANFYGRKDYEDLKEKAKENGVVIYWTHLRIIAEKASESPDMRAKAEEALVKKQLTEGQLKAVIKSLSGTAQKREAAAFKQLSAIMENYRKLIESKDLVTAVFDAVDNEYDGSVEQGQDILTRMSAMMTCFEDLNALIEKQAEQAYAIINRVLEIIKKPEAQEEDGDIFYEVGNIRSANG